MSKLNDIEFGEHINAINRAAATLNRLTADVKVFELSNLLDSIRFHAKGAQQRLSQLNEDRK